MTNFRILKSYKLAYCVSFAAMIIFIISSVGCSDVKLAKELSGEWQTKYITSFDNGEKDSTTETLTFVYKPKGAEDDGSFIESRNCKTNEIDEDDFTYKVHYLSTVSGRFKINDGDLYLNYDLSTLNVKVDRNDVKITPKSLAKAYDMFGQALTVGLLGDVAGTGDDWKQIADACKKETYKNLFGLYKEISSNESPYENIHIDGNKMSYDTDDGTFNYVRLSGELQNNQGNGKGRDSTSAANGNRNIRDTVQKSSEPKSKIYAKVIDPDGWTNVRSQASANSTILRQINSGEVIEVSFIRTKGKQSDWLYVPKYGGYVYLKNVKIL